MFTVRPPVLTLMYNNPMRPTPRLERILAIKLADMGDLLNVTPALQALRAAYPKARIDLLATPASAGLLKGAHYIDSIVTFDKFAFDSLSGMLDIDGLLKAAAFMGRLRLARYDGVIIFHHFTSRWGAAKFAMLALASGAKVRIGLDNGRGKFLTHRYKDRGFGAMHEADYWLNVVALLGADASAGWRSRIPVGGGDRDAAEGLLASFDKERARPIVAIHPGAGGYSTARIWPVERFAGVAKALAVGDKAGIVILGGPDEESAAAQLETMLGDSSRVLNLVGRTTIHQTAAVIERCDLFLGNDSGPMHIAAAVETPVVAVFGPSNRQAWGPYIPRGQKSIHRTVSRDLPCMPCFYRAHSLGLREGCGTRPCLTGLPVGTVLAACREALSKT